MSFKSGSQTLSFSDLELFSQTTRNNTLDQLDTIDGLLEWRPIETVLTQSYPIGRKKKGPQAYPPLMLFKCLLLRNWFQIRSDAELESLVNDRVSFKKFVGLPMQETCPDSSTFSRFRKRITETRYNRLLSDISDQLSQKNIILNMGSIIDLKIVRPPEP